MGLFPSVRVANRVLYRLSKPETQLLYRIGSYVFLKDGKRKGHPTWIYSARPIGPRMLEHQIFIAQLFFALSRHMKKFAIGSQCKYREDLTQVIDEDDANRWEVDRATEKRKRVLDRVSKFGSCTDPIIFATTKPSRIEQLKRWTAQTPQRNQLYFCLIQDAIADPFQPKLLQDIKGERYDVYYKPAESEGTSGTPTPPVLNHF